MTGRLRMRVLGLVVVLAAGLVGSGCSRDTSDPYQDLAPGSTAGGETAEVLTIGLVVPESGHLVANVWEQVFRVEAPRHGVLSEVVRSPLGQQAETVRELERRGVAAIVVVPDPTDTQLAPTLKELSEAGLPFVFLDRGIEVEGLAVPVVRFTPAQQSAQRLVEAAVEEARKLEFPDDAPAVMLVNGPYDDAGREQLTAIKAALEGTKLNVLPDLVFEGYVNDAKPLLQKTLEEHPDLAVVIANDSQGGRAAISVRDGLEEDRKPFVVAAFDSSHDLMRMAQLNLLAALVVNDVDEQTRRALATAISLARGEEQPGELIVESRFNRAAGPPPRGMPTEPRAAEAKIAFPPEPGGDRRKVAPKD